LAHELRKGTIDRIMAMSDLELGLQALLEIPPPPRGVAGTNLQGDEPG
jgi:hypothetical protein